MRVEFLIVGAGPTGLGAAHHLARLGAGYLVVDSDSTPGGLAKSVVDSNGFTWDMGGHVQFSHYAVFDEYMDRALGIDGWLDHVRQSWIWVAGRFVPYPLQNNVHRLPEAERSACMESLSRMPAQPAGRPANFRGWIDQNFGDGLAKLFMHPYNLKVWAHPLELMGTQWVGERVAIPSLRSIEQAIENAGDDVSWGPNRTFRFPKLGGTGAVWSALAAQLDPRRLRLGEAVVEVDPRRRTARLAGGAEIEYEHMVSTMPVDLLTLIAGLDDLHLEASRLRHSTTHIVGVGLSGSVPAHLASKNWMYFPESNCPFYRVTVFSNYSPNNVPSRGMWSLMAEVSESPFKAVDRKRVAGSVIDGMRATGLISDEHAIESLWHTVLPYGYPIPSIDRDEVLEVVLPALERMEIYSRGRFGGWKYEVGNQDHSFMQGWECIERIEKGAGPEAEPTLHSPGTVNAAPSQRLLQHQ